MSDEPVKPRLVQPPRLPRFPRYAVCPKCGKGDGRTDTTVVSYVSTGHDAAGPRFVACGYCCYDGPEPVERRR